MTSVVRPTAAGGSELAGSPARSAEVERRRGLVESQDARILGAGAGNRDVATPPEVSGHARRPCFVFLRQRFDEFVELSGAGGGEHFLAARIRTSVVDVVEDQIVEQLGVAGRCRSRRAGACREAAQVVAVDRIAPPVTS